MYGPFRCAFVSSVIKAASRCRHVGRKAGVCAGGGGVTPPSSTRRGVAFISWNIAGPLFPSSAAADLTCNGVGSPPNIGSGWCDNRSTPGC